MALAFECTMPLSSWSLALALCTACFAEVFYATMFGKN